MFENYKRKQNKCNGNAGKFDLAGSLHVIGNLKLTTILDVLISPPVSRIGGHVISYFSDKV